MELVRNVSSGLITRPEESNRLCCVIVCDQETSRMRRLKPSSGLYKPVEEEEELCLAHMRFVHDSNCRTRNKGVVGYMSFL